MNTYHDHPRRLAAEAAQEALNLALAFILDNDGEYRAMCEERDKLFEALLAQIELSPRPMLMEADLVRKPVKDDGK